MVASTMGAEPTIVSTLVETSAIEAKLTLDRQKLKDLLNKDNATTMTMDAKLMVSIGHEECQKLKNLLNKKEATVSNKNQAPEVKPSLMRSQLRFLAAASHGDFEELTRLLSRTGDVEEGNNVPAPSAPAASLLESINMEGDTALHLVAANVSSGDYEDFKRCAKFIHEKEKSLLSKTNNKGDTPVHCAARAGNSQLVSYLIGLAKDDGKEQDLLRMNNNNNETALHEAVRAGDNETVEILLRADPELALFPTNGTSPLYLTILMIDDSLKEDMQARNGPLQRIQSHLLKKIKKKSMAQTLHDESKDSLLSYMGPNGQNALHVAVLRGPVLTRKLLRWNKDLTIQKDENGSTPLHFAAGLQERALLRSGNVCSQVFDANPDAVFQPDNNGLSPIHVAASVGKSQAVALFIKKRPSSAGLRDAKGRTFLHVAVENKKMGPLYGLHMWGLQARIMNMQDNDGNTALHLAVKAGSLLLFCALYGCPKVHLNITNAKGQTPIDIAEYKVPPGLFYTQNSEVLIRRALELGGAQNGASRRDHFLESYRDIHGLKSEHERKELENMKALTQTQSIATVLIATVAFGATFALPGGYRADDHTNGGTPTLAGRYAFDGFLMANTLAFMFSTGAVICLVRGGSPAFNRNSRKIYLGIAFYFMEVSITCFIAAFGLGAFAVLSPVAPKTAIAISVMTALIVLFDNADILLEWLLLVPSFSVRRGSLWAFSKYASIVVGTMVFQFWPFLLIFIWAAYGRTHPIS